MKVLVLYKEKELNQVTENDQNEIKTREVNLEKLKKKTQRLKT